jgi:hypothetical protein
MMDWVLFKTFQKDGMQTLDVDASGSGGLSMFRRVLSGTHPALGGFVVLARDGESVRMKSVFVMFASPEAPARQRAWAAQHKGALLSVLPRMHLVLEVDDVNDLTEMSIAEKLVRSGGAHSAQQYDFAPCSLFKTDEQVTRHDEQDDEIEEDEDDVEEEEDEEEEEEEEEILLNSEMDITVGGLVVSGDCLVQWQNLKSPIKRVPHWAIFEYRSDWMLVVDAHSRGGFKDLIAHMDPASVQFAALSVPATDSAGSKRTKVVFIFYSPPAAKAKQRAIAANHKSVLLGGVMSGAHVVFEVDDLADISPNDVVLKLIASGGAHAASSFDL